MAQTRNIPFYLSAAQITCTLASLASGSTRESAVQTNTTTATQCFDVLITVTFTIASGTPSTAGPAVNIYANGSADNIIWPRIVLSSGAPFQTGAGDASVGALGTPSNLRLIGSYGIQTTTSSGERSFTTQPLSVASAFGGNVPPYWSLMVENQTGVALSTSATSSTANYVNSLPLATSSGN